MATAETVLHYIFSLLALACLVLIVIVAISPELYKRMGSHFWVLVIAGLVSFAAAYFT